jgi:flagellar hook protein FlgE
MIYPAGNSLSALHAYRKKMSVMANNVSNVQTDGFKKSRVTFSESKSGGISANVEKVDTPGIPKESIRDDKIVETESSNVDLAEELPEMISTKTGYKANLKTLRTQDDLLGSLLDILG